MKCYLAIDIGASSGRHIVGFFDGGQMQTREVYRFPNGVKMQEGHLVWDVEALFENVVIGIREAFSVFPDIESLSIDTWGVDYVLLKDEAQVLPVYSYRDSRTESIIPEIHQKLSFSALYSKTGCQFQPFNTVYQLYCDLKQGRLNGVTDFLMIPEYLMWRLCGVKAKEYTNATTTGLVNAEKGQFDAEIVEALELPKELFCELKAPKTCLGELLPEIASAVGGTCKVVLCATHDTASAVEGIMMEGNHPYISSGTWSLLGVKTQKPICTAESEKANYSNEGGVGYNRYQKNIMGMWIVNELRKELCKDVSFEELTEQSEASDCTVTIDVNSAEFLAPKSMKAAFDTATENALKTVGDYFKCAYLSLAESYKKAIAELETNTGCKYESLYIVGGGAKNVFLNRLTEEATGKRVIALPIEATALGNLKLQSEVF